MYIRFMNKEELDAHIAGKNNINEICWSEKANSTNKGWCFFETSVIDRELWEFALKLGRETGNKYTHYMYVESSKMTRHIGEYYFLGSVIEYGITDFRDCRIVKYGSL